MKLTREEIEQMPAGLGMDELIAALMAPKPSGQPHYYEEGQTAGPWKVCHVGAGILKWCTTARYSVDIAAAWQVVEHLAAAGWGHKHQVFSAAAELPGWQWTFMRPGGGHGAGIAGVEAPTAPLAICRAALLAVAPAPTPATEGAVEA